MIDISLMIPTPSPSPRLSLSNTGSCPSLRILPPHIRSYAQHRPSTLIIQLIEVKELAAVFSAEAAVDLVEIDGFHMDS